MGRLSAVSALDERRIGLRFVLVRRVLGVPADAEYEPQIVVESSEQVHPQDPQRRRLPEMQTLARVERRAWVPPKPALGRVALREAHDGRNVTLRPVRLREFTDAKPLLAPICRQRFRGWDSRHCARVRGRQLLNQFVLQRDVVAPTSANDPPDRLASERYDLVLQATLSEHESERGIADDDGETPEALPPRALPIQEIELLPASPLERGRCSRQGDCAPLHWRQGKAGGARDRFLSKTDYGRGELAVMHVRGGLLWVSVEEPPLNRRPSFAPWRQS
eukprot:9491802-Pyramimonas_sp.AAC.4